jgi:hypothetical protein
MNDFIHILYKIVGLYYAILLAANVFFSVMPLNLSFKTFHPALQSGLQIVPCGHESAFIAYNYCSKNVLDCAFGGLSCLLYIFL